MAAAGTRWEVWVSSKLNQGWSLRRHQRQSCKMMNQLILNDMDELDDDDDNLDDDPIFIAMQHDSQ